MIKNDESLEVARLWAFANDARAVDLYLQQLGTKIEPIKLPPRNLAIIDKRKLLDIKYSMILKDLKSKLGKISVCTCGHNVCVHVKRMCACGHSQDAHTYIYSEGHSFKKREKLGPCGHCNCVKRKFSVSPKCKKCSCTVPKYSVNIYRQRKIYLDQIMEIEQLRNKNESA